MQLNKYYYYYNAPTMLPTGSLEAEAPPPLSGYRPATSWVHYTTSCNTQSRAPEDGSDHRPKHVELIGIINKPLLSHPVGVYIIYINYARSNKYKIFRNVTPCSLSVIADISEERVLLCVGPGSPEGYSPIFFLSSNSKTSICSLRYYPLFLRPTYELT